MMTGLCLLALPHWRSHREVMLAAETMGGGQLVVFPHRKDQRWQP